RMKTATREENTVAVLANIMHNPHVGTREIALQSEISQRSILRILHAHKFHPYHLPLHQELHGTDFENRIRFCQWFLHQMQNNDCFLQRVLFTDKATFINHGQVNLRNMHWAPENPH
ncbi:hypothetical protein X777_14236, partial [Ooceraea biroi]